MDDRGEAVARVLASIVAAISPGLGPRRSRLLADSGNAAFSSCSESSAAARRPRLGAAHLRKSLSLKPGDLATRLALANALVALGAFEEADKVCPTEVPDPALGRLHGFAPDSGSPFARRPLLCRVVESEPGDWEIWNNLGNARALGGRHRGRGRGAGAGAAASSPDAPAIHYNLATASPQAGGSRRRRAASARRFGSRPIAARAWFELGKDLAPFSGGSRRRCQCSSAPQSWRRRGRDRDRARPRSRRASPLRGGGAGLSAGARGSSPGWPTPFSSAACCSSAATTLGPAAGFAGRGGRSGRAGRGPLLSPAPWPGAGPAGSGRRWRRRGPRPSGTEPVRRAALIGQARRQGGRTRSAFLAYAEMNRLVGRGPARRAAEAAAYRAQVGALAEMLTPEYAAGWPSEAPTAAGRRPSSWSAFRARGRPCSTRC